MMNNAFVNLMLPLIPPSVFSVRISLNPLVTWLTEVDLIRIPIGIYPAVIQGPTNVLELPSLIGFLETYLRFIPNLS